MENENTVYQEEQEQEQAQLQVAVPKMRRELTIWNDKDTFKNYFEIAQYLAKSELIPQAYRGKPADIVIAASMGDRIGIDAYTVMASSQIINGNFSWKGKACKSMIDGCGLFMNSNYIEVVEREKDSWGYYLEATRKSDGAIVRGVTVTIAMANLEGWTRNAKWKSMPELMLKYRAAAFFMRTECPAISMGFLTSEEVEDIAPSTPTTKQSIMQALDGEEE